MRTYPVMNRAEPAVSQPDSHGWNVSWNPDDDRWYIEDRQENVKSYADRRNAIAWTVKHPID